MLQEIHIAPLEPSRLLAAASATGRASAQQCTGFAFDTKVVLTDALIKSARQLGVKTYAWSSRRLHRGGAHLRLEGRKCVVC